MDNESHYLSNMKVSLYEFNAQTDLDKTQVVLEHGNNLKTRKDEGYIVNLYSLYDFYVEIWYDEESNRINKIRSFKSIDQLGPYIDGIDLGQVLKEIL